MSVDPRPPGPPDPGWAQRQPVLIVNTAAAAVFALCALLREFGVPLTDGQQSGIVALAGLILLTITPFISRKFTTPLADPRDANGQPLVPVSTSGEAGTGNGGAGQGPTWTR